MRNYSVINYCVQMGNRIIPQIHWVLFSIFIILFLALDLGVFNRHQHQPSYKEALSWSAFWIGLSIMFGGWIYFHFGSIAFFEYITSYKIEKILSLDNIMIFAVIFKNLNIPMQYQHRVLFIGIISALALRALMIFLGVKLLQKFYWLLNIFGIFLAFAGIKILFIKEHEHTFSQNKLWNFCQNFIPLASKPHKGKFLVVENGKYKATSLLLALIFIEISDIIFAIDSLPAIFSITSNPFLIYTSNILAILGLRSLYFVLGNAIENYKYLKPALGLVLIIIGTKLIFNIHIHPAITFTILTVIFISSVLLSVRPKD